MRWSSWWGLWLSQDESITSMCWAATQGTARRRNAKARTFCSDNKQLQRAVARERSCDCHRAGRAVTFGSFYFSVVGAIGAVLFSGLVIKMWRRHSKCTRFHTVPSQMLVRQRRNCRSFADTGTRHRCRRPLAFTRNSRLGAPRARPAKRLMGSLTKERLTASPCGGRSPSLLYGLEAGCTIGAPTRSGGTRGALITSCCRLTAVPASVGPDFIWFVFWAKCRHFTPRFTALCSPLQSLTTVCLQLLM